MINCASHSRVASSRPTLLRSQIKTTDGRSFPGYAIYKLYQDADHPDHCSLVANPYNCKFQNCTEHTLDVLNAAIYRTDDINVIKADGRAYFKAQKVTINPLKMLAGMVTMPDLQVTDQQHGI